MAFISRRGRRIRRPILGSQVVQEDPRLESDAVRIAAGGTRRFPNSRFERCLRAVRPGDTVSSLGIYSGKLAVPVEPFVGGLGDHTLWSWSDTDD